jgi:hypothetical protein
MTTRHMHLTAPPPHSAHRARQEAKTSLWMLGVFALWTAAFIVLSPVVAQWFGVETQGGEVPYIENWFGWVFTTLVWVAPLLAGLGLAWDAGRRGARNLARTALIVNAVVLIVLVVPSLLDRLVN